MVWMWFLPKGLCDGYLVTGEMLQRGGKTVGSLEALPTVGIDASLAGVD